MEVVDRIHYWHDQQGHAPICALSHGVGKTSNGSSVRFPSPLKTFAQF
jgi:hypothetical protein